MATHSSILAWEIPWSEEPGRLQSMGSQESDMTEHTPMHAWHLYFFLIWLGLSSHLTRRGRLH